MRTTLTLDDDVAVALERLRRARRQSLKAVVNETLRRGLGKTDPPGKLRARIRTRAVSLGLCRFDNVDNVAEVLAVAEGERFR